MIRKTPQLQAFSLSFIDLFSCAFGGMTLVLIVFMSEDQRGRQPPPVALTVMLGAKRTVHTAVDDAPPTEVQARLWNRVNGPRYIVKELLTATQSDNFTVSIGGVAKIAVKPDLGADLNQLLRDQGEVSVDQLTAVRFSRGSNATSESIIDWINKCERQNLESGTGTREVADPLTELIERLIRERNVALFLFDLVHIASSETDPAATIRIKSFVERRESDITYAYTRITSPPPKLPRNAGLSSSLDLDGIMGIVVIESGTSVLCIQVRSPRL